MSASTPVALILGAGSNIGKSVGRKFASSGYKVALAARSINESESTDSQLNIKSDFSNTDDVVEAFLDDGWIGIDSTDDRGETALMAAAQYYCPEAVELILQIFF